MIHFPENYVVFDFETSGLSPNDSEVIEYCAMKKIGGVKTTLHMLIKPSKPIEEKITALTGITNDHLDKTGGDPEERWKFFRGFIGNYPLIGHNSIAFDKQFMDKALSTYNLDPVPDYYHIDTAMLFKAAKLGEKQKWYENHYLFAKRIGAIRAYGVKFNLAACAQELGFGEFSGHRANSDVEMTDNLYMKFLEE